MTRPKILCTLPIDPAGVALIGNRAEIIVAPNESADTFRQMVGEVDLIVVRTKLPDDLLDRPHRLLGIVRCGTGLDMIPVEAATAQNVPVANVPGVNAESVAEYCFASMLSLIRHLHIMDRELREKNWHDARRRSVSMTELKGRTLGVVGVGAIGTRVAEIGKHAFGMHVLGHQRRLNALPSFVAPCDIDTLCRDSDFINLTCPLTPETHGLINAKRIASMKTGVILINVSRGPVVDETALASALRERRIGGAGIDVYSTQPVPRDHPFLSLDNVLLTPHCAGLTQESAALVAEGAAAECLRLLEGKRPQNLVNPTSWDQSLASKRQGLMQ